MIQHRLDGLQSVGVGASGSRIDREFPNIQNYFLGVFRDNLEIAGSTGSTSGGACMHSSAHGHSMRFTPAACTGQSTTSTGTRQRAGITDLLTIRLHSVVGGHARGTLGPHEYGDMHAWHA